MRYTVTHDPKNFAKQLFKAGQQPAACLRSAGHLRDAAEAILKYELPAEISYSQAFKIADEEASAESVRGDTGVGSADIKAIAPNYPPAQLRYAYAIENVLKGLIVFKRPDLIQEHKLHGELKKHDLNALAEKAKVTVEQHERPVLEALTHLSIYAGRYPIALGPSVDAPNPNALLGYGSAHPIMRAFFERAPIKSLRAGCLSKSLALKKCSCSVRGQLDGGPLLRATYGRIKVTSLNFHDHAMEVH